MLLRLVYAPKLDLLAVATLTSTLILGFFCPVPFVLYAGLSLTCTFGIMSYYYNRHPIKLEQIEN